jgi:predicted anti-sigma-YlaC factor YlaD
MEIEFDKEIDAILRKARGGEVATSFDSHIDADEIAAFAENALSDLTQKRYTAHLADCTRCRKILSNVIALNSEAELETASSAVLPKIVEVQTPWYRKLFAFPQAAYTMGALVVLFSGFLGYVVLKNVSSGNSEVSYSTDKGAQMEKSAPQSAPTVFSNSNSATAANTTTVTTTNSTATVATNTTTTTITNSASVYSANKAVKDAPTEKKSDVPEIASTPSINQPTILPAPKPQDSILGEDDKALAKTPTKNEAEKPNAAGSVREENKKQAKEDSYSVDGQDNSTADSTDEKQKAKKMRSTPQVSNLPQNARKTESYAGATRSVGGKTFNNVGGIWFDSAVGKQKQKTVKRGSKDYQKLDSGLRSIADQFGGTVVILWNGKTYRIQ